MAGIYWVIKIFELLFFGLYIVRRVKNIDDIRLIVLLSSFSLIFEASLAILQYFYHGSINNIFYFLGERRFSSVTPGIANASIDGHLVLRPYATFSHPNVLAGYLLIWLIFVSSFLKSNKNLGFKAYIIFVAILGTFALFLTLSRLAIFLWLMYLLYEFARGFVRLYAGRRRYFKAKLLYGLLSLVFIIALLFLTPAYSRFLNTRLNESALVQREKVYERTYDIIRSNLLLGVGPNNFLITIASANKSFETMSYLQPVHSIYLLLLVEVGIVSFLLIVYFLYHTVIKLKLINNNSSRKLLIILSVILALGCTDHYLLTLQQGQLLLTLILGICWAM